jgi:putative nucleotidyltransferase with HDIG domain
LFNQTDKVIQVIENNVAEEHLITDFFTTSEAYLFAQNKLSQVSKTASAIVLQSIGDQLLANVVFDQNKTKSELKYHISMLSPNTGMVLRGQNIVSKGEIISSSEFVVLESLRFEIEKHGRETNMSLIIGRFILVIFPIIALSLFLFFFREDIFSMSKNLLMIFMLMIFMVGITRYIVEYNTIWVFALPLMISPIILRAFYDSRLAFMVHIVTVIIISFVVPDAFMFTYLQIITGLITIISVHKLQKRSQFFYTALFIFITYSMMYLGVELITEGDYLKVNWSMLVFFAISAGLTLLATPLIFIFERFFGLVTDVSLLEYSDTNNLLIRRLSIEAPGTFHHCIQVSNLAEAAAIEIGANQLMVRAGAMYHDIGKMENPMYFTENQGGYNPHDELTYEESAKLIIGHVLGGVEMAKEHGLPSQIIDFIRTHHGTKKVEYFYRLYKSELPDHEIKDSQFTYPGPTPFSKETSILMMADAVEAASRSIKSPDAKSFSDLVEKIIKSQIDQGQFNNANITMREINTVKKVFKKKLLNMHHLRIEYPEDSN